MGVYIFIEGTYSLRNAEARKQQPLDIQEAKIRGFPDTGPGVTNFPWELLLYDT